MTSLPYPKDEEDVSFSNNIVVPDQYDELQGVEVLFNDPTPRKEGGAEDPFVPALTELPPPEVANAPKTDTLRDENISYIYDIH